MTRKIKSFKLAVYENLSTGGARSLLRSNIDYFHSQYDLKLYTDRSINRYANRSLLHYMDVALRVIPKLHRIIAQKIRADYLICYHSWITKSPYLLRLVHCPTIYICHEPPREFYDSVYISMFTWKEKIVNLIRLPIKVIDRNNIWSSKNIKIIANSQYSRDLIFAAYGLDSHVVYPGIRPEEYKFYRLTERENNILVVGAINKLKNQRYIAECVSRIPSPQRPSITFIGNGGDKRYISNLHKYCQMNGIRYKIRINASRAELLEEYAKSKIFAYSPNGEPFGLVVLEAMASGLPLVVSKHGGGYSEVISKHNAYILDENEPEIWAQSMESLLKNRTMWTKMSVQNRKLAKKYSTVKMNNKISDYIKSL